MKWISVVILVAIGVVSGDISGSSSGNDHTLNLKSLNVSNLGNLQSVPGLDHLPGNATMPTMEEAEKLFEDKCKKNGGDEAYMRAKSAKDEIQECFKSLVNVTELQDEIEKAKPTGDLDEVFKKYCQKTPIVEGCINNFTSAVEPCLEEAERESKRIITNITESLLKFICHKEGDRIALFIAEGGPECLASKQEEVQHCVNKTLGSRVPAEVPGIDQLPLLMMGESECRDMRTLQSCVVKVLETCSEPTPGNIVDSLFNFVFKMTPCATNSHAGGRTAEFNSGPAIGPTLVTSLVTVVLALVVSGRV